MAFYSAFTGTSTISTLQSSTSLCGNFNSCVHVEREPTDALSIATITFSGVPTDCEVRLFSTDTGAELDGIENWTQGDSLSVPYYGSGNSNARWVFIHVDYDVLSFELETPRTDTQIPIVMRRSKIEEQA
jgi:hypothetical protein